MDVENAVSEGTDGTVTDVSEQIETTQNANVGNEIKSVVSASVEGEGSPVEHGEDDKENDNIVDENDLISKKESVPMDIDKHTPTSTPTPTPKLTQPRAASPTGLDNAPPLAFEKAKEISSTLGEKSHVQGDEKKEGLLMEDSLNVITVKEGSNADSGVKVAILKDTTSTATRATMELSATDNDVEMVPKKEQSQSDATQVQTADANLVNNQMDDDRFTYRPSYAIFSRNQNTNLFNPDNVIKTDKIERAESRLEEDEWDTDAWMALMAEMQKANIDTVRCYFGRFLTKFPMAARYWKLYIEKEIEANNFSRVEKCFQTLLPDIPNVDLFKLYLKYMKESKSSLPNFKETMKTAYKFSLDQIGLDLNATSVWQDYIEFLKEWETTTQYDASTKMVALRETYQHAVVNPIQNVEGFWKEYDQYENGLNKLTARKLLQDKSAAYMTARAVLRERRTLFERISSRHLAVPLKGTSGEAQQLGLWKQYIAWEKSNPLKYDDRDIGVYKRVVFAYKQCLMLWYYAPEIWFEYCQYVGEGPPHGPEVSAPGATIEFEKASSALPTSQLLAFSFADYEESKKNLTKATAVYERILSYNDLADPTLVYIQYMKYKRRSESTEAARKIFKRARSDKRTGYQSFVAAALMEYFGTKKPVVSANIFALGLKAHGAKVEYALSYLDYLLHLNESNNTRVLFERLLMTVPPADQAPIWQKYLQFEADYGDLTAALSVEKRRQEVVNEGKIDPICHSIDRYHYLDLYPVDSSDLDRVGYHRLAPTEANAEGAHTVVSATDDVDHIVKLDFVVPDIKCLAVFNPEEGVIGPLAGPKSLTALLTNLPPPSSFVGPYVSVDALMESLAPADDGSQVIDGDDRDDDLSLVTEADNTPSTSTLNGPVKRKRKSGVQSDSDGETVSSSAGKARRPVNIFNKRMRHNIQSGA
eukprot:CFRG2889T1